jgi:hypothetical protein
MTRGLTVLVLLLIAGCARREPPPAPVSPQYDPIYQEVKAIVEAQSNCFKREAMEKRLNAFDIETAALAVQASCAAETQRYRTYSITHTIESVPMVTERMRRKEAEDLQFIKQMLALIRTSSPPTSGKK